MPEMYLIFITNKFKLQITTLSAQLYTYEVELTENWFKG